jgi:heat shock protein HslJ
MLKRNSYIFITMLGALVMGLSACASAGGRAGVSVEDLANTRWELVSYGDMGLEKPVVEGSTVTLEIGPGGQIGGTGGCNSYGGSYELEAGTLAVGEIRSTLMACVDELVMEQEAEFLAALKDASGIELRGDELTILYNEGMSALNFEAAADAVEE